MDTDLLLEQLDKIAVTFEGRVGFAFRDLRTGEQALRNADEAFPTASTIKLPILTAFHKFLEDSSIGWDDAAYVRKEDVPGGSGVLQHLLLPRLVRYSDAAWLMICVSDNLATNVILRAMGLPHANALMHELISESLTVHKYAGFAGGEAVESMGEGTPRAFLEYLTRLHALQLQGAEATLAVARQQVFNDSIPRYLPYSSYGDSAVSIAHKTGALPGIRADVGIVSSSSADIAMVVMTDNATDRAFTFGNAGQELIGKLSRVVYEDWTEGL